MTLSRVAHDTGLSRAYISEIERGTRKRPSGDVVRRLTGFFGLDPRDFASEFQAHRESPSTPRRTTTNHQGDVRAVALFDDTELSESEVRELRRHLKLIRGELTR